MNDMAVPPCLQRIFTLHIPGHAEWISKGVYVKHQGGVRDLDHAETLIYGGNLH